MRTCDNDAEATHAQARIPLKMTAGCSALQRLLSYPRLLSRAATEAPRQTVSTAEAGQASPSSSSASNKNQEHNLPKLLPRMQFKQHPERIGYNNARTVLHMDRQDRCSHGRRSEVSETRGIGPKACRTARQSSLQCLLKKHQVGRPIISAKRGARCVGEGIWLRALPDASCFKCLGSFEDRDWHAGPPHAFQNASGLLLCRWFWLLDTSVRSKT